MNRALAPSVLTMLLAAGSAMATEVAPLSLDETVRQADAIVLGSATAKQSRWGDASRRWMVTDYTFVVEDVLYTAPTGENIGQTVTLTYWGGTLDGETQTISDLCLPAMGEQLVVMLAPGWRFGKGFTPVVGFNEGLFSVSANVPGATAIVRNAASGQPLVLSAAQQVLRQRDSAKTVIGAAEIDLATFKQWLRSNVSSIKSKPSEAPPSASAADPRVIKPFFKTPEPIGASGLDNIAGTAPASPAATSSSGLPPLPPVSGAPPVAGPGEAEQEPQKFSSLHQAHLPIVVNNFPDSFSPWSPEDEYQMAKWNYYASNVFQVYTTPTGTYGWGNGRFDLAGWPSSADLQTNYGSPWAATTIGITFLRYDSGGWITEADIALNPAFSFTLDEEWVYSGSTARSFRQVMMHELGHMHGLDHQNDFLSVMNDCQDVFRLPLLYSDDAAGVRAEYPGNAVSVTDLGVSLYYASGSKSVTDATISSSVIAGNALTVNNYTVQNVGTTAIATPTIEWYLTTARNFTSAYYFLGSSTYPSLAAFTQFTPSTVQRLFTVPSSVPPGNYYLGAYIRNDGGATNGTFPSSNNFAFSRLLIAVTAAAAPNDNFSNRTTISGSSGTTSGSNVGATKETGEPNHYSTGGKSVWWQWTAPASGVVTINTNNSNFDTLLAVYTGVSVNALTLIASDDDGGITPNSLVTFSAVAGTSYKIAVDGYSGASGSIQLAWSTGVSTPDIRITPLDLSFNAAANPPPSSVSLAPLSSPRLVGMTASPHAFPEVQPDGTPIELNIRGGVNFHWLEDRAGYTVVQDGDKFVYAQLDNAGRLAPTTLLVGQSDPSLALSVRTLPSTEVVQQMRAERLTAAPAPTTPMVVSPRGTVKNVVILMRFANHAGRTLPTSANYSTIFNAVGGDPTLAPTGSVRDLYLENSYGTLVLNSTIYGWVTLPHTEQYYANGESGLGTKVHEAITDALNLADGLIDFRQFDTDGNGYVDSIAFVHSGYGAEWGGSDSDGVSSTNRIWSHRWQISDWTSAEGVRVRDYHINPGLWSTSGSAPGRIGVICHETGHFFGLPDLYDSSGGEGIGSYCMMSNSWGFTGTQLNPPHFSAWSKIFLGWMTPTLLNAPGSYSLARSETSPTAYKITNGYPSGEYLLVENRQPYGFESTMPQGGLVVWHIDENKTNNNDEGYPGQSGWPGNNHHYEVALLQADGLFNLEHGANRGDAGDVFHAAGVSEISHNTTPNTDAYQNGTLLNTSNRISAISGAGATMTFNFAIGGSASNGFQVINDGNANLTVSAITPQASAPWISWTPAAPFTLAPGATQFVTVSVNFAQAPQGTTTSRLLVASNDPDENPYPGGINVTTTVISPPVISSAATATGTVGQAFSYPIVATNSPTSYGAAGLPGGLNVNTSSGLISGTPTATGVSTVNLSATNAGGTGTKVLTMTTLTAQEAWRKTYFGNATNTGDAADTADPDGDGYNNLFEYVAGLSPTNSLSRFKMRVEPVSGQAGTRMIIFSPLVTGRTYTVKSKASLSDSTWTVLTSFSTSDNGTTRTVSDFAAGPGQKFYSVEITLP